MMGLLYTIRVYLSQEKFYHRYHLDSGDFEISLDILSFGTLTIIWHAYRKTNLVMNWVAFYFAHYMDKVLWASSEMPREPYMTFFFLIF